MEFVQNPHVYRKKNFLFNEFFLWIKIFFNFLYIFAYYCRTNSHEYYIDVIGNHGKNLIAILHDVDLHILNPSRNLIDKL